MSERIALGEALLRQLAPARLRTNPSFKVAFDTFTKIQASYRQAAREARRCKRAHAEADLAVRRFLRENSAQFGELDAATKDARDEAATVAQREGAWPPSPRHPPTPALTRSLLAAQRAERNEERAWSRAGAFRAEKLRQSYEAARERRRLLARLWEPAYAQLKAAITPGG